MLLKNEAVFLLVRYLFMQNIVIFVSKKHFWRGEKKKLAQTFFF